MYPNCRAELARAGITLTELAARIGKTVSWVSDKLSGRTALSFSDACIIKDALGVDMTLEELFATKDKREFS